MALWPGAAQASTVSAKTFEPSQVTDAVLGKAFVTGEAGEDNRFRVRPLEAGGVEVRDDGASLQARGGCRSVDTRTAVCEGWDGGRVILRGRDGDDVFDARALPDPKPKQASLFVTANGGAGADRLLGRILGDAYGGRGDDTMRLRGTLSFGNVGFVHGDDGDDDISVVGEYRVMERDGDGRDRIHARQVSFERRREPIRVDLRRGRTSDGDHLEGVYRLTGGRGPDVLLGSARGEWIKGAFGEPEAVRDVIRGRGGPDLLVGTSTPVQGQRGDLLYGGPGTDDLKIARPDSGHAGSGRDQITLSKGARVRCGAGVDLVHPDISSSSLGRVLPRDCERQPLGIDHILRPPRPIGDTLVVRIGSFQPSRRRVSVRLQGRRRPIGHLRIRRTEELQTFRLRLTPQTASALAAGGVLRFGCELRLDGCAATRVRSHE